MQWGSFADAGFKELVAAADPTLNISERPVSERYILGDEIGCGSYGRAVLATRIEDGLSVVVKQIRLFEMDEKARMDTLNEARVLAQFNHVNIVHYHECLLESGVLNIVMEYANGGDLATAIQRRQQEKKPFSEDEIMFWFVQVVLALYHVHGKNVLHRDLKSQNIFIAAGNLLKLGDFGIARVLNSDTELARTVIGSPYYLSPEICEDRPYNRKSDVWSLGCVLYELSTLRRAFDGQSLPALVVKILRGKYPPVPTRYSTPLRSLIESMLKQDPKDRPSADAILRKDFVRQHLERYAVHVVNLGLSGGGGGAEAGVAAGAGGVAGGGGSGSVPAATAAALGLAALGAAEARPRPSPAPHRTPRSSVARPPRGPSGCVATPGPGSAIAAASAASSPALPASAAPGGLAGGEAERCSSYDASETETASTTPAEGSSPSKHVLAARRGQQRLVDSGWVRQQQAALAQLEGALAAQRGAAAGAAAAAGGLGGGGEGTEARSPGDGGMEATLLGGAGPSGDRGGGGGGGGGGAAGHTGFAGVTAAKAKLAELKLQRDAELEAQRRANAAMREQKKAAAARRNHEAAVAVRNRAAERQKEIERNLAEQKAEMEAKAQKAMQLAAAVKAKEDARRREQEEVAHHMSAHREHVRAARSRINKDQLAELGAQFKSRMATALSGVAPGGGEAAAGGPQVLVVDFAAAHHQQQQQQDGSAAKGPPARLGAAAAGRQKAPAHSVLNRPPRSSAAAAAVSDSDGGAGPSGRGRDRLAVEPPWKQRHKAIKAVEFPDVQIFTPFGSEAAASPPAAAAAAAASAGARASGAAVLPLDSGDVDDDDEGDPQAAAGVLEVLAQIHTVLEEEGHEGGGAGDGDDDGDGAAGGAAGGVAAKLPPPPPRGGAAAAAANALKVEELRIDLERQLGPEAFLAAYRCLREMQERADVDADADGAGAGAGGSTQSDLERILGPQLHLARQVHKLITLEDSVFS